MRSQRIPSTDAANGTTTVCGLLLTLLVQLSTMPFEQRSTHFIEAWSADFETESGSTQTFAMATLGLYKWLSDSEQHITKDHLVGQGMCTPQLAESLVVALDDSVHHHSAFAKQLAMLAHHDLQRLFGAFYRRRCAVSPPSQPKRASTSSVPRRTRFGLGRCKCIWPWRRAHASKWY